MIRGREWDAEGGMKGCAGRVAAAVALGGSLFGYDIGIISGKFVWRARVCVYGKIWRAQVFWLCLPFAKP